MGSDQELAERPERALPVLRSYEERNVRRVDLRGGRRLDPGRHHLLCRRNAQATDDLGSGRVEMAWAGNNAQGWRSDISAGWAAGALPRAQAEQLGGLPGFPVGSVGPAEEVDRGGVRKRGRRGLGAARQ